MSEAPKPKVLSYYTFIPDRAKPRKYHSNFGYVKTAVKGCFGSHCVGVASGEHNQWECFAQGCRYNGRIIYGSPYAEVWELGSDGEYKLLHTIQVGTKREDLPW